MSRRTETAYKAEPQGESAQHDEAHPDLWGMVNAAVVQGKIMFLPGEICQPKRPNGRGGTEPAKVRVNMAEGRYIAPAISAFTPSLAISAEDENPGFALEKGPRAV